MNVNISIDFDNMTDAAPVLAALAALTGNVQVTAAPVAASTDEAPKPRGKGKKAQTALEQHQEQQLPAGVENKAPGTVDPSNLLGFAPQPSGLDALISGVSAAQLPPSPMAQPAAIVPQIQAQPLATVAVVGQKQLIEAFTALGSAPGKGPDAIRAVLAKFNVATVTAIPVEQYANAVAACKQVLAG
jgi:hypothetical protein